MTSSYLKHHVAVTDDAHKGISGNGESSGILTGVLHGGGGFGQVLKFIGRARSVLELLGGCSHKTNPVPLTPSESSVALSIQNTYKIKPSPLTPSESSVAPFLQNTYKIKPTP